MIRLLVLSSIATHNVSLTSTTPTITSQLSTPGEHAITTLLRLVLYPPGTGQQPHQLGSSAFGPRLPSFLSSGAPRDRRGRLARRSIQVAQREAANEELGQEGSMTTIGGGGGRTHVEGFLGMSEREREGRELLESLRSPNLDVDERPEGIGMEAGAQGGEGGESASGGGGIMESLGTGPGGWGAAASNTTQDLVTPVVSQPPVKDMNPGRRAAIYEDVGSLRDEDSDTFDERSVLSVPAPPAIAETQPLNLRRPSRAETDGDADTERREPERRPRI
ncbi:hypothetical protein FRC17_002795 [Serendipita sp. 399]|nr:hypothetical protein FRC17_002795 [Serendipita sp. 399]